MTTPTWGVIRSATPASTPSPRGTVTTPRGGGSKARLDVHGEASPVQGMLHDLVSISHHIAAYIEKEGTPRQQEDGYQRQQAALKMQEIERIVRRVELHFTGKLSALEAAKNQAEKEAEHVRKQLEERDRGLAKGMLPQPHTHDGYRSELETLKQSLKTEREQRLRVEEQTQLLTEQHVQVISTLERRLQRQEEQLHDLTLLLDKSYSGSSPSPSPTLESGHHTSLMATPRRLLRQQLDQHRQTTESLQQYKSRLMEQQKPAQVHQPPVSSTTVASRLFDNDVDERGARQRSPSIAEVSSYPPTPSIAYDRAHRLQEEVAKLGDVEEITTILDKIARDLDQIGSHS